MPADVPSSLALNISFSYSAVGFTEKSSTPSYLSRTIRDLIQSNLAIISRAAGKSVINLIMAEEWIDEEIQKAAEFSIFLLLVLYTMFAAYIEAKGSALLHETTVAIMFGMLVSGIAIFLGYSGFNERVRFSDDLFFYVALPPIVFNAGYNLKRRKFFKHFNYIALFGILGTFVCFCCFAAFTTFIFRMFTFQKWVPETGDWTTFMPTLEEILLLSSLMCSSDVVAAVSIINFNEQPKLYSMVFGEGITNDAVSIILFNAVVSHTSQHEEMTWASPFQISWEFSKLAVLSMLVGIVWSMLFALLFKYMRFLTHSPVHETLLVFSCGYLAYMVSELFELSGIITLLSTGISLAHYAWYNLSPQSKQTTSLTIEAIGYGAEAFVFVYLGLTCFSYSDYDWSYQFFIAEFVVLLVGRYIGTVCLLYFLSWILRHKREMSFREALYLYIGGMIRGAIAFGLVLRMDESLPNREVIITTSLCMVIVTTVVFGSSMPIMTKYILVSDDSSKSEDEEKQPREIEEGKEMEMIEEDSSFHEVFKHPNQASLLPEEIEDM